MQKVQLNNGVEIPVLGFGVFQIPDLESGVLTNDQLDAIVSYVHSVGSSSKGLAKVEGEGAQPVREMYMNTTGYVTWKDPSGNPAIKPPWGMLHALNLSTGEYEWEIPLGNDDKRQAQGGPETGLEGKSGPIVTAGDLVFIAGAEDKKFRAFEKATGKLLWETTLPAMANATACTYMVRKKQYVALSVGGTKENPSGFIMAFALP